MKIHQALSLAALGLTLCAWPTSLHGQTVWHDPAADPHQPIQGTGWAQEALSGSYQRLPDRAEKTVRKQVWDLSQDCAGMYLKFHTNATSIQVRYQVSGALSLPHMPATGVSGVDLYATDCNGRQYWCAPQFQFGDTICYTYPRLTYRNNHGKGNEYTLYLPLYNHVRWLQIGTPEGSLFGFLRHTREKPVVIYGTSIAQGACASRPGMAWSNILQRELDLPVVNLGFSGNGQLEETVFNLLAETDAALYVIDCMPNMTGNRTAQIQERLEKGIGIIRKKSSAPILLVEHDGYMGYHTSGAQEESFRATNRELRAAFSRFQPHVENLHYLSFEEIGMDMDSQVDGTHASDWGMRQYATAYGKKIAQLLFAGLDSTGLAACRQHRDADTYQWSERHEDVLAYNARTKPDIVMMGNSITHFWGGLPYEPRRVADDVWQKLFEGHRVANLGFGWDRLENMAWRIVHGELDGFRAEKIFMLMGTNNLDTNTDEEIIAGIKDIVRLTRKKQPEARLYVVEILPRRHYEERLDTLNRTLRKALAHEKNVRVIDLSAPLLTGEGKIRESLFSDGLHPNHDGYKKLARLLKPYLKEKN